MPNTTTANLFPSIPGILAHWAEASALSRANSDCQLDLRYGEGPFESLDLFAAPRPGAPVLVFIHGGYWRSLDKSDFSFIAPAFNAAGAMVVVPNYALCPAVSIEQITWQMVHALQWVWRHAAEHRRRPATHRRGRAFGRRPPGGDDAQLSLEAGGR